MVKALVIVAHPDDETIWCGGTILENKRWRWVVLSLCRRDDADRAPRFARACKQLGAKFAMSDLEDEHPELQLNSLDEVEMRIAGMLRQNNFGFRFDYVFTHGANGEYGHLRHIAVHDAVRQMVGGGRLRCKKIFFFNYKRSARGNFCVPNTRTADVNRALRAATARAKRLLITFAYNFSIGSFEEQSANATESFKVESACDH
ncbi:MAG: PIG-L family deacetylase [Candidatus Diapherotrites archaeon]|nr:PIG-L family deacetylase [Candidatus Diapherotrites archaeon]